MSEYCVVKYIDGEPIQVKKENATNNNTKGFNGCVWGPPCPTCYWSSGDVLHLEFIAENKQVHLVLAGDLSRSIS